LVYFFSITDFLTTKAAKDTKGSDISGRKLFSPLWLTFFLRELRALRGQICCFFFGFAALPR